MLLSPAYKPYLLFLIAMLMIRRTAPTANATSSRMTAKLRKAIEMEDRTTSTPSDGGSLLGPEMGTNELLFLQGCMSAWSIGVYAVL